MIRRIDRPWHRHESHGVREASFSRRRLAEGTHFLPGSMAPKIEAVVDFLERGGGTAIITDPENVERALAGETGTHIVPG